MMMMKGIWLLFGCSLALKPLAQKTQPKELKKQFSFTTENDNYLMQEKDGYYTNGIFLNFSKSTTTKKGYRAIENYELSQLIFTPETRRIVYAEQVDRPFCGYLYAGYGKTKFLEKEKVLGWKGMLGVSGKISMAEEILTSFHRLINIPGTYFRGWEYQIGNEFMLNAQANFATTLFPNKAATKHAKIIPKVQAQVGTPFTNLNAGVSFCLGNMEKNEQSSFFNARTNLKNTLFKTEWMFYFQPSVTAIAYDATIQGGFFNKDPDAITMDPERFIYQHKLGFLVSSYRYTLGLATTFVTRESLQQLRNNQYLSIHFAARFK